jgi:hypothetical protein
MTDGTFSTSMSEARGRVAVPANIDKLAIVLGCSSAGSGLSPQYNSGSAAATVLGYGDAVDVISTMIDQKQPGENLPKVPAYFYTLPVTTAGSYGTIDTTGVVGTVVATTHTATAPYGSYDAQIEIVDDGIIGVSGITLKWSLDGGKTTSRLTSLGTAAFYTIAEGNVRFDFAPSSADMTLLYALINELYTDHNAHVINVTSVHGSADTADQVNGTTYPSATTPATAIARVNAIRAAFELHRQKVSGAPAVHGAADTTSVCAVGACTDVAGAVILAVELKRVETLHWARGTAVHAAADATVSIAASDPDNGAFAAGDIVRVRTVAPAPATADVTAAFNAIAKSSIQISRVVCAFDCDATMAGIISTGLGTLASMGKKCGCLIDCGTPDFSTSETEAAWVARLIADFEGFDDSSIEPLAMYGLITDSLTGRQYKRSFMAQYAADWLRVARSEIPDAPADRPMSYCSLVDSDGTDIGHDEGPRGAVTGLSSSDNRFSCCMRLPDMNRLEDVYSTVPWTCFAADERITNMPTRLVCNALERTAISAGTTGLGGKLFYNKAKGSTPAMLTDASRRALQGTIFQACAQEMRGDIRNWNDAALDSGLVQINPVVTVANGNMLTVSGLLAPEVAGYLVSLPFTLSVQE